MVLLSHSTAGKHSRDEEGGRDKKAWATHLNAHSHPTRWVLPFHHFMREKGGSERLSNFPKVTLLTSSKAGKSNPGRPSTHPPEWIYHPFSAIHTHPSDFLIPSFIPSEALWPWYKERPNSVTPRVPTLLLQSRRELRFTFPKCSGLIFVHSIIQWMFSESQAWAGPAGKWPDPASQAAQSHAHLVRWRLIYINIKNN